MIKSLKFLCLIISIAALGGCAGMNSKFDCTKTGGLSGCSTLGQVNSMADQGEFIRNTSSPSKMNYSRFNPKPSGSWQKTPDLGKPLRAGETIQNIWVAPYETADGSYSWPSQVSIVLRKGHWIGAPVKEIQKSGEH